MIEDKTKKKVFKKFNGMCAYCNKHVFGSDATIDHVIPRSHDGGDEFDNLALACYSCNAARGGKNPIEFTDYLRKKGKILPYTEDNIKTGRPRKKKQIEKVMRLRFAPKTNGKVLQGSLKKNSYNDISRKTGIARSQVAFIIKRSLNEKNQIEKIKGKYRNY